jgi:alpha-galactosidase
MIHQKNIIRTALVLFSLGVCFTSFTNASEKPVKVYILAGQSNMVGMGDLKGARPEYPSVYLSADPSVIPGEMPVGESRKKSACRWLWQATPALRTHGVYQSSAASADTGASVSIYAGAYDPEVNYAKLKPVKSLPVALGTTTATVPSIDGAHTAVAHAFIDVPTTGSYYLQVGYEDSTHALAKLNGEEVYRKMIGKSPVLTKVRLVAGKRYPLEITYLKTGSAALWLKEVEIEGKGDLETLTQKDKKFPFLVDDEGNWTVRDDVCFQEARVAAEGKGSPLSATSNGRSIGPEVGFGFTMGDFHDEKVLLIKTAMGNRSLGFDFRPPSSGRKNPENKYENLEYRLMLKGVRQTLDKIDEVVPGYQGQGYELAGFLWFQGHKDGGSSKADYEENLVNLINDVRKDLDAPNLPAVVATVGFHGYRLMTGNWKGVWEAQMAVGDPQQHPEFAGNVASVDTRDFWREVGESPQNQDYHYNRNPETYLLIGDAMGRAMVRLKGGQAAEMPKSGREAATMAAMAKEAAMAAPTEAAEAASLAAIRPILIDGMLAAFVANPRNQPDLQKLLAGPQSKPEKMPQYLDDKLDDAIAYYQAAGIHEYDWQPVLPEMKTATWQFTGYDIDNNPYESPLEKASKKQNKSAAAPFVINPPKGMDNWFAENFDAAKAGWKQGQAPIGMKLAEYVTEVYQWIAKYPLYSIKRTMAATICDSDVVLMRASFELPVAQAGYRYRVRLDGSIHGNSGEGYAIYLNGELLNKDDQGVTAWRRQGLRGSHVWAEQLDALGDGKVSLAVANYPMSNYDPERYIPAIGPLSVWVEQQKLPELEIFRKSR